MSISDDKSRYKTKNLVLSSLFAALICLTTAYILHIPVGSSGGYVHIGDTFIYLAASIIPTPYAMIGAAIGAGFADLISGSTVWIIPTVIIKPILVLFITSKHNRVINIRNVVGSFIAGFIGWFLYMVATGFIYGSFKSAFVFAGIDMLQPIGSFIAFILIGLSLDRINIKQKIK
ncbi:MAG: TIGR04002 family protein [Paraclostridium sp.]